MQRLSGADASFVYGETPGSHLHLGTLAVLDPSTAPEGFDVHRLRSLVEARTGLLGPFLRRSVEVPKPASRLNLRDKGLAPPTTVVPQD
jgi:hypothetical protein